MWLKEDPQWLRGQWATRYLCPHSPFLSLLSPQPWNWRVSLSSVRGPLSLCLELSDFNEHTCILFVEVSFYPVLKVVWETCDSLCLGTAIGKHVPSLVKTSRDSKGKKMDFTQSKTFFFSSLSKTTASWRYTQNLVPLWNMGKLLDNLHL